MAIKVTDTFIRPSKDTAWEISVSMLYQDGHPYNEKIRSLQFDMISKGEVLPYRSITESEDGLTQVSVKYFRDEKAYNKHKYLRKQIDTEFDNVADLVDQYYVDNNIIVLKDVDTNAAWPPSDYIEYPDSATHDYPTA